MRSVTSPGAIGHTGEVKPDALRALWIDAVVRAGGDDKLARRTWDGLATAYAESHRAYHTLDHVARVLVAAHHIDVGLADDDRTAVELAAFAHDVVHDGRPRQDEQASAAWLRQRLAACRPEVVERAAGLIELTSTHQPPPGDLAAALFCDADLAILAASPEEYDGYVAALRKEYVAVDDATWRTARSAVLREFLDRPRLFATDAMHNRRADARANIVRELETLEF